MTEKKASGRCCRSSRTMFQAIPHAVPIRSQLALAASEAGCVVADDLRHGHSQHQGVDAHFRLDLKTFRQGWKRPHIASRQHPIAGEHILELASEASPQSAIEQAVAQLMTLAIGELVDLATHGHHHLEPLLYQQVDQLRGTCRVVSAVTVGDNIEIRIDRGKGAADGAALPPLFLDDHLGAGSSGRRPGAVRRAIVDHKDRRAGQCQPERGHDVRNGRSFIETRQNDCHPREVLRPLLPAYRGGLYLLLRRGGSVR